MTHAQMLYVMPRILATTLGNAIQPLENVAIPGKVMELIVMMEMHTLLMISAMAASAQAQIYAAMWNASLMVTVTMPDLVIITQENVPILIRQIVLTVTIIMTTLSMTNATVEFAVEKIFARM